MRRARWFIGFLAAALGTATCLSVGGTPAGATQNPAFSVFDIPGSPYPPGSPVVALTFDDGPSASITPQVLDVLARYNVKATFFVVGGYVAARPDLVRRAIAEGHSVQLHTMSHADLTRLTPSQLAAEVDPEITLLTQVTGIRPTCLRPPYGSWNSSVVNQLAQRNLSTIIWNVNPGDTEAGSTTSSIAGRALAGARPGAVMGMHDSATKAATLAALPTIIEGIKARGLTPVPLCRAITPTIATRDLAVRADGRSGYSLDDGGALHAFGGAPERVGAAVPHPLARRVVLRAGGTSGYTLDGFGGVHAFGGAPEATAVSAYWPGWDIARGLALRPDGHSGWVLDAFGGIHPWGGAPTLPQTAYWRGWDIARDIVATSDGLGGYVLDGFGALHPFGSAAPTRSTATWTGTDRARSLDL
ncbi:MAG: polysaccharide deacetylase family protein, partial [Acidimicrobiia bacterium]|nr:polysaccharide deacetylase family protein [Acidimicrobiia bacterium]